MADDQNNPVEPDDAVDEDLEMDAEEAEDVKGGLNFTTNLASPQLKIDSPLNTTQKIDTSFKQGF